MAASSRRWSAISAMRAEWLRRSGTDRSDLALVSMRPVMVLLGSSGADVRIFPPPARGGDPLRDGPPVNQASPVDGRFPRAEEADGA
jgi:hypothetical protein